ncbi:hypothetical protein MT325_m691L [Paramecium bursaria chlorella virus MT325]|uniref:Uncharacterized protein m691L n=1 Tax=Paramecium bursaria Chlorella virus MT325 TaxID=346932 RepID=A7IV71_PBCVM|nr:hypothetical protein MT325_m691L [Paramecium bursaria chlorella virus MT325]
MIFNGVRRITHSDPHCPLSGCNQPRAHDMLWFVGSLLPNNAHHKVALVTGNRPPIGAHGNHLLKVPVVGLLE